jgi:predicted nucleic acid-binding protein
MRRYAKNMPDRISLILKEKYRKWARESYNIVRNFCSKAD